MAKEENLKKIELKVSVNCCDGCKRKVLKALSIKGVLRTEIHPTLPKVTVMGNVDAHILIKKLAKIGKTADVLLDELQKPQRGEKSSENDEKKTEKAIKKEKQKEANCSDKSNSELEKCNASDTINSNEDNRNENGDNKQKKVDDQGTVDVPEVRTALYPTIATGIPQMNYIMNPSLVQNGEHVMASHARVYYPMESAAIPMSYHTMNAYPAQAPSYIQGNNYCELPAAYRPPLLQSQSTSFADYFNEENTVGCNIM